MKVALYNIINNIEQDELDAGRLQEVYDIDVELGKKVSLLTLSTLKFARIWSN